MKYRIKKIIPYILTVLAITLPWFFSQGYVFFTDFSWGPHSVLVWHNNWFFLNSLVYLFGLVLPMAFLEKIFISLVFLVVLFGGKKLAEVILSIYQEDTDNNSNEWLVYIASLFLLFNPFVYDRVMYGQFGVVLSFGFFLFCLSFMLSYIHKRENKDFVSLGIYGGLMILFTPQFFFILMIPSVCFLIYIFRKNIMERGILLKYILMVFGIIFIINANWIIGYVGHSSNFNLFVEQGISKQDLQVFQTSGNTLSKTISNVVMLSGFWGKDQFRYADLSKFSENWGRSFVMLLPVILFGVWLGLKQKKYRLFFVGVIIFFIVSIVLAVGIKFPVFRELTQFLYDYLPFYKIMREPQKWVSAIVAIYFLFLVIGIRKLWTFPIIKKETLPVGIFLVGIIIMNAPFMLWGLHGQIKPVKYPDDWHAVDSILLEKGKCENNALFLPWHLYMNFSWAKNIINNPAPSFFSCKIISGSNMEFGGIYDNSKKQDSDQIYSWIESRGEANIFEDKNLNIKYIILAKEVDWRNYDWLNSLDNLSLILETDSIRLYSINEKN